MHVEIMDVIEFAMKGKTPLWLQVAVEKIGEVGVRRGAAFVATWLATWSIGNRYRVHVDSNQTVEINAIIYSHSAMQKMMTIECGYLQFRVEITNDERVEIEKFVRSHFRVDLIF